MQHNVHLPLLAVFDLSQNCLTSLFTVARHIYRLTVDILPHEVVESFEVAVIELGVLADPVSELFEVNPP